MRLAVKGTLALLVFYFVALGGLALWVQAELGTLATTFVRNTARLIGNEVARAVSGTALEQLVSGDAESRAQLAKMVADLSENSDVVASIDVVDDRGQVIASDTLPIGQQLSPPQVIFSEKKKVELASSNLLTGGDYYLLVPLQKNDDMVGYLRLSIRSQRITRLYRRARNDLLLAAVAGLFAIGSIGLLLHAQILRRSRRLAAEIEGAVRGDEPPVGASRDEFSNALETARRVGRELTQARQESSEAHRRLGAMVKALDVGVILVGPDRLLDFANPSAQRLLAGGDSDELERRWPDVAAALTAPFAATRTGSQTPQRFDLDLSVRGETHELRFEVARLEEDDGGDGYLVLVKDRGMITALENELGLAVQMRGLARFYTAFAHDLKAPLNAMVMNLELLKHSVPDEDEIEPERRERQLRYIAVLREELRRFDRQLHTLLSHAAAPSETLQQLDLRDLVGDLASLFEPQARRQGIAFHSALPAEPVMLKGNRDRLKQAMLNIVINALEAMPEGGDLSIDLEPGAAESVIAIRDTGPGISTDLQNRIYEMSFTTKSNGSGVGLYVARALVEAHGGTIRIDSQVGRGTCFEIFLPTNC
jgi:signal transduction histidine kinase